MAEEMIRDAIDGAGRAVRSIRAGGSGIIDLTYHGHRKGKALIVALATLDAAMRMTDDERERLLLMLMTEIRRENPPKKGQG